MVSAFPPDAQARRACSAATSASRDRVPPHLPDKAGCAVLDAAEGLRRGGRSEMGCPFASSRLRTVRPVSRREPPCGSALKNGPLLSGNLVAAPLPLRIPKRCSIQRNNLPAEISTGGRFFPLRREEEFAEGFLRRAR